MFKDIPKYELVFYYLFKENKSVYFVKKTTKKYTKKYQNREILFKNINYEPIYLEAIGFGQYPLKILANTVDLDWEFQPI